MNIVIVTFDGFNEIDSFVSLNILNRVKNHDWKAEIICPNETVVSMNGVKVYSQRPFEYVNDADAVLFGSGKLTHEIIQDNSIMSIFKLDPQRQLIGSQCSGALILSQLGLLEKMPACTDLFTRPFLEKIGVSVLDRPFFSKGNVATAGGCLSSQYLAAWLIFRVLGKKDLEEVMSYVTPVGRHKEYVSRVLSEIGESSESIETNLKECN